MSENYDAPLRNNSGESAQSGKSPCGCMDDTETASDLSEADMSPDIEDVEDGFDLGTHGGGSIESVEGYQMYDPMVVGLGAAESTPLPSGWETIPTAARVQYEDERETVCGGVDDRASVSNPGGPPWRMICQLLVTGTNGLRVRGTGWFIGPRTVMTAGHCVHSTKLGGWVETIEVVPGMDGRRRPFGSAVSRSFRSVSGWVENQSAPHDYGCIILPENDRLGDKTGWFGFANLSDDALENLLVNNSGYPGDKAFGTQWFNAGRLTGTTGRQLEYMVDTAQGQSGSPVWRFTKTAGKRHVIGIHNYGGCANRSTRITEAVIANMRRWKAQGA